MKRTFIISILAVILLGATTSCSTQYKIKRAKKIMIELRKEQLKRMAELKEIEAIADSILKSSRLFFGSDTSRTTILKKRNAIIQQIKAQKNQRGRCKKAKVGNGGVVFSQVGGIKNYYRGGGGKRCEGGVCGGRADRQQYMWRR